MNDLNINKIYGKPQKNLIEANEHIMTLAIDLMTALYVIDAFINGYDRENVKERGKRLISKYETTSISQVAEDADNG